MLYTRITCTVCILVAALSATVYARPGLSLREKLAKLLMDPEYDETNNDISQGDSLWQQHRQQQHRQGMLLQNNKQSLRLKGRLDSMSIFDEPKSAESSSYDDVAGSDEDEDVATTSTTTEPPVKTQNIVMAGLTPLRTIISRFIEMWRV